ncbi:MAG: UDP-3-O-[3-hydroxymyristoyl] N-acetylglucosamine deacetylase [Betaproteobacteria bacterium AqS2]|uniref:UDP-3-O-acyl-N-acetylglucosamine deacetylase n=1 Tax=Candidatus Amphirhobacter heronislandensis TaxID=1732024 RepID=A0A930UCV9_9GAMM|nr:UDP-3-O-[3-hydroxymyristoyl] N-acetylglucosamine deacetylase [Betaproteobacteria bacterium AqS2]
MSAPAAWPQRSLAAPSARVRGVGLHSGRVISLRLLPAPPDSGVSIDYAAAGKRARIAVSSANVVDTLLATTVAADGCQVATIEHLLAALCICGVDNAVIEIDGPEVPIMDGSAQPFILLIRNTGMAAQDAEKRFVRVTREIAVQHPDDPERRACLQPAAAASWDVTIDFADPVISRSSQRLALAFDASAAVAAAVAAARTFGFVQDVDFLRKHDRGLGGSLDNALVLDGHRLLNRHGLRQDNEFVAHKLLDAIGDCYVEGKLLIASYQASMPGHNLNHLLMLELLARPDAWEEVPASAAARDCQLPDFGPLGCA